MKQRPILLLKNKAIRKMSLLFLWGGILLPTDSMKSKDRRIYVTPVRTDMQSFCTNRSDFLLLTYLLTYLLTHSLHGTEFILRS